MILFFDTETTGIPKNGFIPRIVQIGALLTDDTGKTISELNVLLSPEGFTQIPLEASNVHGFTYEMVSSYGVDRISGLSTFFGLFDIADVVVAHNIDFDMDLLNNEIQYYKSQQALCGVQWATVMNGKVEYCTMDATRDILKLPMSPQQKWFFEKNGIDQKYKNPKLIEAYRHYFGKDFDGAHDAMVDVRACKDVYFALKERS